MELGSSVYLGDFSGFISEIFYIGDAAWARITNWAETNSTICRLEFCRPIS